MTQFRFGLVFVMAVALSGCVKSGSSDVAQKPKKEGIFGKTTQDIGVFDPDAKQEVSDQKVRATDPITAPLAAYGPMVEKVTIAEVDYAIRLFEATEGRYPNDHAEFMEKIIKANNIRLPVLPYKGEYKYDEKEHVLKVVRAPAEGNAGTTGQP